ncbi:MAG TPA: A/G-specific adenine glycosylase [Terriglobia bacterium]|nr:A/G-specific adenine glycosylase [Terriglobia bacterium]
MRRALLRWFYIHKRSLPWRASSDPYSVWVSEVMLQQTQVATVVPYYLRFLNAFPTVDDLARAPLERVLQLWSGLGYYRRARQLHAAARTVVEKFDGRFPATLQDARQLPGVGNYTAAAVLSIAYGLALPALDGNVARVVARLEALPGSLAESAFRRKIEAKLAGLFTGAVVGRHNDWNRGDLNQALMELGQTICLPKAPQCPVCPVRAACRGRASRRPEAFPSPRPRRASEEHHLAAAVILSPADARRSRVRGSVNGRGSVLLARGLDHGLMEDLWNFPSAFGASAAEARARLETRLADLCGAPAALGAEIARVRHSVTYRQIHVRVYRGFLNDPPPAGFRWLPASEFGRAAVSQLTRKIAAASSTALN